MTFWTEEKKATIKSMFENGKKDKEIAAVTGGTQKAVSIQRYKLGLKRREQPPQLVGKCHKGLRHPNRFKRWDENEEMTMKEIYLAARKKGWNLVKRIARKLKRTPSAVQTKLCVMGVLSEKPQNKLIAFREVKPQISALKQFSIQHDFIVECSKDNYVHAVSETKHLDRPVVIRYV